MRSLDIFSGIGGFALGFESAGIETAAFCEVDPFCREWLAQQWPGVPIYPDVRALDGRAVGYVDVVCGGFPCQDISTAGRGEGLDGARSGLWFQMHRIVCEVRPAWVVIENVPRLRTLGADRVYSDMAEAGYTGWFFVVGADDVGAPHRRKRAWGIFRRVANSDVDVGDERGARGSTWNEQRAEPARGSEVADTARPGDDGRPPRQRVVDGGGGERGPIELRADGPQDRPVANTDDDGRRWDESLGRTPGRDTEPAGDGAALADGDGGGCQGERVEDDSELGGTPWDFLDGRGRAWVESRRHGGADVVHTDATRLEGHAWHGTARPETARRGAAAHAGIRARWPAGPGERQHEWEASRTTSDAECELGAAVDGIPGYLGPTLNKARLKAAGNTVVPAITAAIGRVLVRLSA